MSSNEKGNPGGEILVIGEHGAKDNASAWLKLDSASKKRERLLLCMSHEMAEKVRELAEVHYRQIQNEIRFLIARGIDAEGKAPATAAIDVPEAPGQEIDPLFEPFFRSDALSRLIKQNQTVPQQRKFAVYFEEHGCMVCETRERPHSALGMCEPCYHRIAARLKAIERRETARPTGRHDFTDSVRVAREALAPSIAVLTKNGGKP